MGLAPELSTPFFVAASDILRDVTGQEVVQEKMLTHTQPEFLSLGLAVVIGIVGHCQGRFIIDMESRTAIRLASLMNMTSLTELDDLVKSTMGELGNMASGIATTRLQNKGFDFQITPPTLFEGREMTVSTPAWLPVLITPLTTTLGEVRINLAIGPATKID
jgi:chemotaxis protein CheX